MGVEAFDESAVAFGFAGPAAGFGVAGQGFGVGALGGQDGQVAGVGAEVGAVLADVGVGARALDLGADAEAAGEAGLDRGASFQSPSTIGSEARPWDGSAGRVPRWAFAAVRARSYSVRTVESNSRP